MFVLLFIQEHAQLRTCMYPTFISPKWTFCQTLFLQIPTHPASQNMQVGSKPGKTHFKNCISVYDLTVCPIPYILSTHQKSVNKSMRKKRCKECIPNANRVQAKESFIKNKDSDRKERRNEALVRYFSVPKHYKIIHRCQQNSALISCNYCS